MNDPRFPIGKFHYQGPPDLEQRKRLIAEIEAAPASLRAAVQGLNHSQLETPYREGGWTVRQVVHHVADSHMNAYIRFRLALTEEGPTITPYKEDRWAKLADAATASPDLSLALLEPLHQRWTSLLNSLDPAHWARTFHHPELGAVPLEKNLALYAWHGRHHTAHITHLRTRLGW